MKVTGYKLRGALKRWQLQLDTLRGQFKDSFYRFADETKPSPSELGEGIAKAERSIALLQTAQARYNLAVSLHPPGFGQLSLLEAVKVIGGIDRTLKLWTDVSKPKKDKYSYLREGDDPSRVRANDKTIAARVMSVPEAAAVAVQWQNLRQLILEAIASGNATELDIDLPGGLLT